MSQTTYPDNIRIEGSQNTVQLAVKGHSAQTAPLQVWQNGSWNPLGKVTSQGYWILGEGIDTGLPHIASVQMVQSGAASILGEQAIGRVLGAVSTALTFVQQEVQILGTGGISGVQTAHRVQLLHEPQGSSFNALLKAGEFRVVNERGIAVKQATGGRAFLEVDAGASVAKGTGLEVNLANASGGQISTAVALEGINPTNSGTIDTLIGVTIGDIPPTSGGSYALRTGTGLVRFGDALETKLLPTPSALPSSTFVKLYLKLREGAPALYGLDENGVEYTLSGSLVRGASTLDGVSDTVQLQVRAAGTQTADLQQWQSSDGTIRARVGASGRVELVGAANDLRWLLKSSPVQNSDLIQFQTNGGTVVQRVSGSGALFISLADDALALRVRGHSSQTHNLQQWQNGWGGDVAAVGANGQFMVSQTQITTGATAGAFLKTNSVGLGDWSGILPDDLAMALTTPPPIGTTSPAAGTFVTAGVLGANDDVRLLVRGHSAQTNDLQQWQKSDGTLRARLLPAGGLHLLGELDAVRVQIKGAPDQSYGLIQLRTSEDVTLLEIGAYGAHWILGNADAVQLTVRAHTTQTSDLQQWRRADGTLLAQITGNGGLHLMAAANNPVLFFMGSATQNNDLVQIQTNSGSVVQRINGEGALAITPGSDGVVLCVQGHSVQTNDLQRWQNGFGGDVAVVDPGGLWVISQLQVTGGAGANRFMKSDSAGSGTWSILGTNDLSTAFAAPAPIGSTSPSTGAFTRLSAVGAVDALQLLVRGHSTQSADLQEWQQNSGAVVASLSNAGLFTTSSFRMTAGATSGRFLRSDASGTGTWQTAVTSIALTMPGGFSISGSPVTTTGTLAVDLDTQSANMVFAGPSSGGAAAPSYRALAGADLSAALVSPPTIGGTTPEAGTFTTLTGSTVLNTRIDAETATVVNGEILTHNSTATPTTGFGTGLLLRAKSSTTTNQSQGRIRAEWVSATDASRTALARFTVYDTAERTGFELRASGTAPMIGFLGATPAVQPTGGAKTAAATYGANEQSMLQALYGALRTLGLLT